MSDENNDSGYKSFYGIDYDCDGKLTSEDDTLIDRRMRKDAERKLKEMEEEDSHYYGFSDSDEDCPWWVYFILGIACFLFTIWLFSK